MKRIEIGPKAGNGAHINGHYIGIHGSPYVCLFCAFLLDACSFASLSGIVPKTVVASYDTSPEFSAVPELKEFYEKN